MSSVTPTCSPNSFQLRLALNSRRPPTILVRLRVQKLDRQIRLFSVVGDNARNSDGLERRAIGNSWTSSNSSVDSFSGWSGANGGESPVDPHKKRWFEGIIGAGAAAVVVFVGVTFATLSISKRNASRLTKEMEPLTKQQEVLLASDSLDDTAENNHVEDNDMMKDESYSEGKTGIVNDPSSFKVNSEAASEDRQSDADVGHTVNGGNTIKKDSVVEDFQFESSIGDTSDAPEENPVTPQLLGSGVAYGLISDDSLVAETSELVAEHKEKLIHTNFSHSSTSDISATIIVADDKEGLPGSGGRGISDFSSDSSSTSITDTPTEPMPLNVSVNSPLVEDIEPQILHKENIDSSDLLSASNNSEVSTQHVLTEGNNSPLEEHILNGDGSSGTHSVPAVAYTFANNEQEDNNYNSINGGKSFFESVKSGNFFSSAGIPAPSVVSAALQVVPGKVLVPAVVDQVQGQALAALQVLKVVDPDAQPGDLCTRREYARWLVSASSALSRSTVSKVYSAMYIENVTELAFDDITPADPDFPSIQGLAEAGLISSKLSRHDMPSSLGEEESTFCFSPECPLSRQDLVSWKMALEKRLLVETDRKTLHQLSGFIDIDKINPDAWPAIVADLSAGEHGIIALAFGYTRLFQPDKPVTKAQAAIALATGEASDIVSEELARIEAESMAENVVAAHNALVAQVERDVNASFEEELFLERKKIDAVEKMAEAARNELERLRAEREADKIALIKERAAVESEMEVLSKLRHEVEEQLEGLMSNKVEISYEKEWLNKLRKEAEVENQEIARLQHDLEVERKALSMARAWAEDEAKRAREQAKILEEVRDRWERHGIKVVVDDDLRDEENVGVTWANAGKQFSVEGTVSRAENLINKLKAMAADVREKSKATISSIIQKIQSLICSLKEWAAKVSLHGEELKDAALSKMSGSLQELQQSSAGFTSSVKEGAKRIAGDCRESVEKLTQKFKT